MSLRAVVREFRSEADAAIAAATLRANGIDATTTSVGGGVGFNTTMAGPTAVIAPAGDVQRARAVLDKPIR